MLFQIIMNSSLENTQKKIDKALKRNLEKQIKVTENKTENNNLPTEEMAQ